MSEVLFAPYESRISPDFWNSFSKMKLDVLKLNEEPLTIFGKIGEVHGSRTLPPILEVDNESFKSDSRSDEAIAGILLNQNTIETFKNIDKTELMLKHGTSSILENIRNGSALISPSKHLNFFLLLTYGDLKKYRFYYWFGFPAIVLPKSLKLKNIEDLDQPPSIPNGLSYFIVLSNGSFQSLEFLKEKNFDSIDYFGFADSCTMSDLPGWPMRNFLALLLTVLPPEFVSSNGIKVLSLRNKTFKSKMFTLIRDGSDSDWIPNQTVGWERNANGAMGPRVSDMKSSMDPKYIAETSVDLNLKLMRWRLVPDLELSKITSQKVLILGSGTLGCNVARACLAWGIRNITFVDNSKVSYSNPVRQSLFEFEDCVQGGKHKAEAASEKMKKIFPNVKSSWKDLSIPMAGHPISESLFESFASSYNELDSLISNHDVIYLLMDSRESRWLPTALGALRGKLIINAALGFDTYLVMRHGMRKESASQKENSDFVIFGDNLGCYFCNDIVAPGDSLKDRTLDQQCTVTRPGVSYQAASLAVELMASILQHPLGGFAPVSTKPNSEDNHEGVLGTVPHSIRGSVSNFTQFTPATSRFDKCSACSIGVLLELDNYGLEFVRRVCNDSSVLEEVSGLKGLLSATTDQDILELSDEELEN